MVQKELDTNISGKLINEICKFVRKRYTLTDTRYITGVGILGISEMGHGIPYTIFIPHILIVNSLKDPDWRTKIGDLDFMIKPHTNGNECKVDFLKFVQS